MAEIVNLRAVRKARVRASDAADAAANRLLHGRTKAERLRDRTDAARQARLLDGARRDET